MEKFCTKCGEPLNEGADFCLKCGNKISNGNQNSKKKFPIWAIMLIVVAAIFVGIVIMSAIIGSTMVETTKKADCLENAGLWIDNECKKNTNNGNNNNDNNNNNSYPNSEYSVNKLFKFDNLEITISDKISFTKVENQFSNLNGKDIVVIPATIKNLKDETHSLNMFFYRFYGSKGTKIDSASTYFMDESVDFGGGLRSGATYTKNFYIVYDGDGDYYVEFNNFSQKFEVKIPIKK